jgi:hypothetical protein
MAEGGDLGVEGHRDEPWLPARPRRGYACHGGGRRPWRTRARRARLHIRVHAGRADPPQGALPHPVANRRQPQDAALRPAVPRDRWPPHSPGVIRAGGPCVVAGLTTRLPPAGRAGCTRPPVPPWGAVGGLGPPRGCAAGLPGAPRDRPAPAPPGRCSRRRPRAPPVPVVPTPGRRAPHAPASPAAVASPSGGSRRSTGLPPLRRSDGPLRHPRLGGRCPGGSGATTSRAPPCARWEAEGFARGVAWPCPPAVAPPRRRDPPPQPDCGGPCCRRQHGCRRGLRGSALPGPPRRARARRPGHAPSSQRGRCRWASGPRCPSSLPSALQGSGLFP